MNLKSTQDLSLRLWEKLTRKSVLFVKKSIYIR